MKTKNGIPIISEAAEDKLYRQWCGEISKFPEYDKINSDKYDFEENLKREEALGK